MIFEKNIDAFLVDPALTIANKRLTFTDLDYLSRVDLTFRSAEAENKEPYPYLHDYNALKQLLPVPSFLLKPLVNYRLPYNHDASDTLKFSGQKTVIYIHGSGSLSEDNSILHQLLIREGCDLIRIFYHIDYEKEGIHFPKKATDMLPFLKEVDSKIAPALNTSLKCALDQIKNAFPDLFINKEVIVIGHSMGGGFAANLIARYEGILFSKFINLDGTLMDPALQSGLTIKQLHLSQDQLFKKEWLNEATFIDPIKAIGQDYCKKIDRLLSHSSNTITWLQIKNASHFTFTDFPDLLKPYKLFKGYAGDRESAARIRNYVMHFIRDLDALPIDAKDTLIKKA